MKRAGVVGGMLVAAVILAWLWRAAAAPTHRSSTADTSASRNLASPRWSDEPSGSVARVHTQPGATSADVALEAFSRAAVRVAAETRGTTSHRTAVADLAASFRDLHDLDDARRERVARLWTAAAANMGDGR